MTALAALRERVEEERLAQGLPVRVAEPGTVRIIASLIRRDRGQGS